MSEQLKVLITGANGQLGKCLLDRVPTNWQVIALNSEQLDITNTLQIEQVFAEYVFDVVINAAAYTAVDKAESEPEKAFAVNATGVANLAVACHKGNIRLIHISTDYVFDGKKNQPYTPSDPPNPITVYGKSKLAGELLGLAHNPNTQIIRTSWVYSEYGNNFVKTMLRLANEGKSEVKVVNDQIGCPTYAGNLAQYIIELMQKDIEKKLLHYCDNEVMTWYEFACQIFKIYSVAGKTTPLITPITAVEYHTPAMRPKYSVMTCNSIGISKTTLSIAIAKLS